MKQVILLAIAAVVLLSSCAKQKRCYCSTGGQPGHEILGFSKAECSAYEAKVVERKCTYSE